MGVLKKKLKQISDIGQPTIPTQKMTSYNVHDDVPILFTATAEKDSLNEEFKNLNWLDQHKKMEKKQKKDKFGHYDFPLIQQGSNHYYTPFGWSCGKYDHRQYKEGETKWQNEPCQYSRHGIEIKWTTPCDGRTRAGKFKFNKITIKELKEACKMNGLKKLPNKKLELVKLLLKV